MPNLIIVNTTANGNIEVEFDASLINLMPTAIYKKICYKQDDILEIRISHGDINVEVYTGYEKYVLDYQVGIEINGVTATSNQDLYDKIKVITNL